MNQLKELEILILIIGGRLGSLRKHHLCSNKHAAVVWRERVCDQWVLKGEEPMAGKLGLSSQSLAMLRSDYEDCAENTENQETGVARDIKSVLCQLQHVSPCSQTSTWCPSLPAMYASPILARVLLSQFRKIPTLVSDLPVLPSARILSSWQPGASSTPDIFIFSNNFLPTKLLQSGWDPSHFVHTVQSESHSMLRSLFPYCNSS